MNLTVKYYPDILRICRSLTPNGYEDLAQEVCLKAIENKEKLQDHNFIGWVFKIATNLHISKCRLYYNKNVTRGLEFLLSEYGDDYGNIYLVKRSKVRDQIIKKSTEEIVDYKLELDNLILEAGLTDVEKLWIKAFIEKELNYSKIQSEIGINRFKASQRLKEIKKKLDYLTFKIPFKSSAYYTYQ